MIASTRPRVPIPEPLRGEQKGSFAHNTVAVRIPGIARRVLTENDFPPDVVSRLEALIKDLPHAPVRPLTSTSAPDAEEWEGYVERVQGKNWLQVPWFFAETYFYRRVLEATGYFEPGPTQGVDPFTQQKRRGLEAGAEETRALSLRLNNWIKDLTRRNEAVEALMGIDLWGNQADLSLWPVGAKDQPRHASAVQSAEHLLVNDAATVAEHVSGLDGASARVDFIADNAGFELVCDLCLTDYLLESGLAHTVLFHVKAHPTFVSDVIEADVQGTVNALAGDGDEQVRMLAGRLQKRLAEGRLKLSTHSYWTSPLSGWEMPEALRRELSAAQLVISKGDANYRRMVGDRRWPPTTPFEDVVCYFPAPLLALRALKAEVAVGLRPGQAESAARKDPGWMVNGRWGVIQFMSPPRDAG